VNIKTCKKASLFRTSGAILDADRIILCASVCVGGAVFVCLCVRVCVLCA